MGTSALPERNLTDDELKLAANTLRRDVIDMLEKSKSGHPGGSLSAADIVATLFFSGVMKYNHNNPEDHTEDRFFLIGSMTRIWLPSVSLVADCRVTQIATHVLVLRFALALLARVSR